MNNCGNRENNFHQFFFVKSEHYIRAITSRGKWGKGGGKKGKKKGRATQGGVAGFGEKRNQRNQPNSDAAVRENLENGGI